MNSGTSMTLDGMDASGAAAAFGACFLIVAYCVMNQVQIASAMDDCMLARKKSRQRFRRSRYKMRRQVHNALRSWKNHGEKASREMIKDIAEGLKQQSEGSREDDGSSESD